MALLAAQLDTLQAAHRAASEGSTHEEARAEHSHDTRAVEQSYLARGQAKRVEELQASLAAVRAMPLRAFGEGAAVELSALVTLVDDDDRPLVVWLAPAGGGSQLSGRVQVTTPQSALGQELLGKTVGESVTVGGGAPRELTIERVE
jgi:transcription elongation GreA/GreB family factor